MTKNEYGIGTLTHSRRKNYREVKRMEGNNRVLYCDYCKARIEKLTEEEALNDLEGHGWTNHDTAEMHICYDCADEYRQNIPYEAYVAGRISKGKVFRKVPDIWDENNGEDVEVYSSPQRKYNQRKSDTEVSEAKALRTPPTTDVVGIRAGDLL